MPYNFGDEERAFIDDSNKIRRRGWRNFIIVSLLLVIFIALVIVMIIINWPKHDEKARFGFYKFAAVATDSPLCSTIGKNILLKNGSAVDAAIASMLCAGLYHAQSCGVGGGFFMIVYDIPNNGNVKQMLTFDARETAPATASEALFINSSSPLIGGKSIGVPGEVKGYHEAWLRFGKLPWEDLFVPVIQMCQDGFIIGSPLAKFLRKDEDIIRKTPSLAKIFIKEDGEIYKEGDRMYRLDLVNTFKQIAANPLTFYTGDLARDIVKDIQDFDGIITLDDLSNYTVRIKPAFSLYLKNLNISVYSLPPPSSGPIYAFMLRLLDSLDLNFNNNISNYQKIVETFKFGYALKSYLGDEDFENLTTIMANLTSIDFMNYVKSRVDLNRTHNIQYYNPQRSLINDGGTTHLSIVAPNGGVVSATSTINQVFGSQRRGERTGIIFNDEIADFTFDLKEGSQNYVKPGKRPQSAMCPAILLNGVMGPFRMAIGGAGGIQITGATTFVTALNLWMNLTMADAVTMPRLHHQLVPNQIFYQHGFPKNLLHDLEQLGHVIEEHPPHDLISIVQAVEQICYDPDKKCLFAVSDGRKNGEPDGF